MVTLDEIKEMFRYWTRVIWGDKVADYVVFDYEIKEQKSTMAIGGFKVRPKAFGNSAYYINKYHHIYITPRTLNLPREKVERIVKHEIIHIGYQLHNEEFFKVCQQFGADLTELAEEEKPFKVQLKEGSRYRTINRFDTEHEAIIWMKQYFNEHKPNVLRMRVKI